MMWLPNTAENILLQLAASTVGLTVVTTKDAGHMAGLEEMNCKGIVTSLDNHLSSGKAAPSTAIVPPIVTGTETVAGNFLRFAELLSPCDRSLTAASESCSGLYCYGSARAVPEEALLAAACSASNALQLCPADRVCVPITMNHTFGFGSGALAAFSCGASLVLPSATPCADATLRALRDGCTVLYADAHTLRALLEENVHSHEVPALRGGLCKIGSGEAIGLGEPREFAGCSLATIGKPASK